MAGRAVVDLDGDLEWTDFDIPRGTSPVRLATLRVEPSSQARTLLVRFPIGWARPARGYYSSAEEMVLLEGVLRMCDETYRAGDWVYVPAGTPRWETSAEASVLALARFDGPARWTDGGASSGAPQRRELAPGPDPSPSPLGAGRAWLLHRGDDATSWLVEAPEEGRPAPVDAELLAPGSRTWAWVPGGEALPGLDADCFCRTFEATGERGGRP